MIRVETIPRKVVLTVALAAAMAGPFWPRGIVRAADVKVTQGPPREKAMFSPIFLEMPLEVNAETSKGAWVNLDDFDAWTCDFVHLRRIATRIVMRKDHFDIEIRAFTFTEASRDKAVRLEFHLFKADEAIGEALIPHIEAEEKKRGYGSVTMSVPREAWPAWPADTTLVMKIGFYVSND